MLIRSHALTTRICLTTARFECIHGGVFANYKILYYYIVYDNNTNSIYFILSQICI